MLIFELEKLETALCKVNVSRAQRPQVSPAYWVKVLRVKLWITIINHGWIHFKHLKEYDYIVLQDILCILVNYKLFVPLTRIVPLDSHIEELSRKWQEEVYIFVFPVYVEQVLGIKR